MVRGSSVRLRCNFTVHVSTYAIVMAMAFPMEDFSDISIEELEDWNDLVLNPHDDEIGIHTVDDFANNSSELKRSASSGNRHYLLCSPIHYC